MILSLLIPKYYSIGCEFSGHLFHAVREKRQQVRWDTSIAAGGNQWK